MDEIIDKLFSLKNDKDKAFIAKLNPVLDSKYILGIKTGPLRDYAKWLVKENKYQDFLKELPHKYFEENQLHSFIIGSLKDYNEVVKQINIFLPYVDNWATCDQLDSKIFNKHKDVVNDFIYLKDSDLTYSKRFLIELLMHYYLDDLFDAKYFDIVINITGDDYYLLMMRAWYFATALAKQYDSAIKVIENRLLDTWTHNKTIQKSIESYRISDEQKEYLRSLKIK